jgi:hypothetical protein
MRGARGREPLVRSRAAQGAGAAQGIGYVIEDNAFYLRFRFRGRSALPGARARSSRRIRAPGSLRRAVSLRQRCAGGRLPAWPSKVVISHRGARRSRRETLPVRPLRALRALRGEIIRACLPSPPRMKSPPGDPLSSSRSALLAVEPCCPRFPIVAEATRTEGAPRCSTRPELTFIHGSGGTLAPGSAHLCRKDTIGRV